MPGSRYQPDAKRSGVALCLSGGGFRAALFHGGALRRLNELGVLGKVTTITSVSGGSIASGLLARHWRTFTFDASGVVTNFDAYELELREFCSHDLRTGPLVYKRLDPRNWPALWGDDHSATDFLAQAYEDRLTKGLRLGDLPAAGEERRPRFVFCASNLQTGVSFELSARRVGDYQLGYADAPEVSVADAVAASSSFPVAFPPLVLKLDPGRFSGGRLDPARARAMARRIVLSDGGVYDNMGLEPVWKSHATVLVSDGGKPFQLDPDPGTAIVSRLLRVQDVIGNQALALRKRWLVSSFQEGRYGGAYWGIGTEIDEYPQRAPGNPGYLGDVLAKLEAVRTDLNVFHRGEQHVLMNHGWVLADAAVRSYTASLAPAGITPGTPPDPELLADPAKALAALG